MKFCSAISQHPDYRNAAGEVTGEILEKMGRFKGVAFLFVTPHYINDITKVISLIDEILAPHVLCGMLSTGVIGTNQEVEFGPGISLMTADFDALSAVEFSSWDLFTQDIKNLINSKLSEAHKALGTDPSLALVFTTKDFPYNELIDALVDEFAQCIVAGGISPYQSDLGSMLFLGKNLISRGAIVIFIATKYNVKEVIAMGAKAVGQRLTITKAHNFLIEELAGKKAIDKLILMASETLTPYEIREVNSNGLFLALFDEQRGEKNSMSLSQVLGTMPSNGAIAVSLPVHVGQSAQFYVRDADFASNEITTLLQNKTAEAALIFSSHLRGTNLFKKPHHDARAILNAIGYKPTCGCFTATEFAKISKRASINNLSSTIVLFNDTDN
jgi:small ligand-binding sensory domain FIST